MPDQAEQMYIAGQIAEVGNYFGQASLNNDNQKWSERQAEIAYNRSIENWNRTNAYNTPAMQMQRMREAGLNPNLIYGNINNTPATNSINYQPIKPDKKFNPLDSDKALKSANFGIQAEQLQLSKVKMEQEIRMNDAVIQNMELRNKNLEQDTTNKELDASLKVLETAARKLNIEWTYKPGGLMETDLEAKKEQLRLLSQSIKEKLAQTGEAEARKFWAELKNQYMDEAGINIEHDNLYVRQLYLWLKKAGVKLPDGRGNTTGSLPTGPSGYEYRDE